VGSSADKAGTARQAGSGERDQTVYDRNQWLKLRKRGAGSNLADMGRDAVHDRSLAVLERPTS